MDKNHIVKQITRLLVYLFPLYAFLTSQNAHSSSNACTITFSGYEQIQHSMRLATHMLSKKGLPLRIESLPARVDHENLKVWGIPDSTELVHPSGIVFRQYLSQR